MFPHRSILLLTIIPVVAGAYYSAAPIEPLASFENARAETPASIRADVHLSYGFANGVYDDAGSYADTDDSLTAFLGVAKLGYVFDDVYEADVTLHGANFRDRNADAVSNGVGDIWISAKGVWLTKPGGEFRMGPRLAFRIPSRKDRPVTDGNGGLDAAAIGLYERRGSRFLLDCQLGFRHDLKSDVFPETPGLSAYILADPAWILGDDDQWRLGPSVGGYVGAGAIPTSLFWLGGRAQWIIDENVRLEAGVAFPVAGASYARDDYSYGVVPYNTLYFGVQSVIPTRRR